MKKKANYVLFYGEPKRPFIQCNDTFWSEEEFSEILENERDEEAYNNYELNSRKVDEWGDICSDDYGLRISNDVAEYLLGGSTIGYDIPVEIELINK